jgi:hypothetical protein
MELAVSIKVTIIVRIFKKIEVCIRTSDVREEKFPAFGFPDSTSWRRCHKFPG